MVVVGRAQPLPPPPSCQYPPPPTLSPNPRPNCPPPPWGDVASGLVAVAPPPPPRGWKGLPPPVLMWLGTASIIPRPMAVVLCTPLRPRSRPAELFGDDVRRLHGRGAVRVHQTGA